VISRSAEGKVLNRAAAPVSSLTGPAVMRKRSGRPSASITAYSAVFNPPFLRLIRRPG
jgi:hypothetical protein